MGAIIFATLGFLAVFKSENEAGTAIALLLAGVLTLVGIQGTPLLRITAGENSIELDHTRQVVAEKAEEEAIESPSTAEAILDAYEAADPSAAKDPSFAAAKARIYELQVKMALRRVAAEMGLSVVAQGMFDFDLAWRSDSELIVCDIKYYAPDRPRGAARFWAKQSRRRFPQFLEPLLKAEGLEMAKVLVVANDHDTASTFDVVLADLPIAKRVLAWKPEDGDDSLRDAILHLQAARRVSRGSLPIVR